jgi:hypothetical protein
MGFYFDLLREKQLLENLKARAKSSEFRIFLKSYELVSINDIKYH